MDDVEKITTSNFLSDLDNIALDLVHHFRLKFEGEIINLSDRLFRWLDFRLRYVEPRPRRVFLSNRFPKQLPKAVAHALLDLVHSIQKGKDINPYQGKGLITNHDISGKKRQHRTDLLWADWGIIHLHLSDKPIPPKQYFSERPDTGWLLFGMFGYDEFACIDALPHVRGVFSDLKLVQVVAESWPQLMEKFELRGLSLPDPADRYSSEEHEKLRKSGSVVPIIIGDRMYVPLGGGLSTASTPVRLVFAMDKARELVKHLASVICATDSDFRPEFGIAISEIPRLRLCLTHKGIAIYDPNRDTAWSLPKKKGPHDSNWLADLHDLIAPEWATEKIFGSGKEIS